MDETVKVREIFPAGCVSMVLLGNGTSLYVPAERIERLGVTRGAELKIIKSPPDIFYYFGKKIFGCFEDS